MKAISYVTVGLLLIIGGLHLYFGIKNPSDPKFVANLIFGIVYFTLGVLMIKKIRLSTWLGFIISLVVLGLSPLGGYKNLDTWTWIMLAIFALTVICCLILLLNKKKT